MVKITARTGPCKKQESGLIQNQYISLWIAVYFSQSISGNQLVSRLSGIPCKSLESLFLLLNLILPSRFYPPSKSDFSEHTAR